MPITTAITSVIALVASAAAPADPPTATPAAQLEALIAQGQPKGENAWPVIATVFADVQVIEAKLVSLVRAAEEPWAAELHWSDFTVVQDPDWRDDPRNDDLPPGNLAGTKLAERLIEAGSFTHVLAELDALSGNRPIVAPLTHADADDPTAPLDDGYSEARRLARILVATAVHNADDSQNNAASRDINRTLALANAISAQRVPIAVLVGAALEDFLFDAMQQRLYQADWDPQLLQEAIAALDRHHHPIDRARTAGASRLVFDLMFADADEEVQAEDPAHEAVLRRGYNTRDANYNLARTALAIEHHRLSTGRLPETLADLPPPVGVWNYLTDPFTGAVLRYRPDPTWPLGFALYSLGPDGDDDGGAPTRIPGEITDYPNPMDALLAVPIGDIRWAAPNREE